MVHARQPSALSTVPTVVDPNGGRSEKESPINSVIYSTSPTTARFTDNNIYLQAPISPSSLPPYIPYEPRPGKMLILCFDGTGDQFDADNSNIVQLVSMLKKDDKTKQMIYYQAGIGTYTTPSVATPFMSRISKVLDEMLAWNLDNHVMGGYEFLMQNYVVGDRICIFGFSRGAYTARSLAGMIHKVGLLPKDNHQQVPFAYKMYMRADSVGWNQSDGFKRSFSVDVPIEFVGVWDTVDSVGLIPKRLPFTTSNTIVRTFRHAVSLDERRAKFKVNLWNRPTEDEQKLGFEELQQRLQNLQEHLKRDKEDEKHEGHHHDHKEGAGSSPSPSPSRFGSKKNGHDTNGNGSGDDKGSVDGEHHHSKKSSIHRGAKIWTLGNKGDRDMNRFESMYSEHSGGPTNVEEVWFSGCHCDVGGGSVDNETRYSLARIPLRWMVRECFKTNTGIMFKTESLREIGLDPATIYPVVLPRPSALFDRVQAQVVEKPPSTPFLKSVASVFRSAEEKNKDRETHAEKRSAQLSAFVSEEDEELRDALSPKYDQLKMKKFWWVLELLPVSIRYQKGDDQWVSYIGINMGKARFIPKQHSRGVKIHRSVKLRMEAQCKGKKDKYKPKPDICIEPTWID